MMKMGEEALIFNWRPLLRKSKYLKFHRNTEYVFNIHRKRLSTDLINFSSNLHPLALQSSQGDFSSLSMRELKRAPQILHLFRSIALDLDLIFFLLGEGENANLFAVVWLFEHDDVALRDEFCGSMFPAIYVLVA